MIYVGIAEPDAVLAAEGLAERTKVLDERGYVFDVGRERPGYDSHLVRPRANHSTMMMLVATLMGCRLHRLIEMVRIDLQAEHRLHILASLDDVAWLVVSKMFHVLEAMLHLPSEGIGKQAN